MSLKSSYQSDSNTHLKKQFTYNDFFFVKKNTRSIRININDIHWVEADGPSVKINYTTGNVIAYANLSSFEKQIQHRDLTRVHRSYIVNLIKIDSFDDQFLYIKHNNREIKIPMGRTYRKEALSAINQLKAD